MGINDVVFSTLDLHKKFWMNGKLYEKLDSDFFADKRKDPTNAYNLFDQQYENIDPSTLVVPHTYKY